MMQSKGSKSEQNTRMREGRIEAIQDGTLSICPPLQGKTKNKKQKKTKQTKKT